MILFEVYNEEKKTRLVDDSILAEDAVGSVIEKEERQRGNSGLLYLTPRTTPVAKNHNVMEILVK